MQKRVSGSKLFNGSVCAPPDSCNPPSLHDCWAWAPVTLSATDRWIAYTQPCFQWSSVAASHGAAALRRVGSVTTAEALEKIAV